jgi:phosphoadenosine phosphosulfate reductase
MNAAAAQYRGSVGTNGKARLLAEEQPLSPGLQSGKSEPHPLRYVIAPPLAAPAPIAGENIRSASADEIAWLAEQSARLEGRAPEEILTWAVERYGRRFTMATGLGPEGCVIISMLAAIDPKVYVFNLDTGYQFRETLELRDRIAEQYGIEIDLQRPELSVPDYESAHGGPVYSHDPDRCCFDRKITVLHRVAANFDAWATGIRRDQSPTRADTPIVKWDKKFGLVKISPLAGWTKKDVWRRILDAKVPYNPLHDQGYPSIGCQPCTSSVQAGEDERAGRWSGSVKTECGLHTGKD